MKINEVLKEGILNPKVSSKGIFVKTLVDQIQEYIDSIRKTKQPLKMIDFVESYLSQHRWIMTPQQTKLIQDACAEVDTEYNYFLQKAEKKAAPTSSPTATGTQMDEGVLDWAKAKAGTMAGSFVSSMGLGSVNKLANAIYSIAVTQQRDPRTGTVSGAAAANIGTVDNPQLDDKTEQIIKTLTPMKGENYKDDLESIVRLALNNLYKTDPGDYSTEVKRIMGQKATQP